MKENLTQDELKYICEVFFKNNLNLLLSKLFLRKQIAKKENNIKLVKLLEIDIETLRSI